MSISAKNIEAGDYETLYEILGSETYNAGEVIPELSRIVSTGTLIDYLNNGEAAEDVVLRVLEICIGSYIYLDYNAILLAAASARTDRVFGLLIENGAAYIADSNEVLQSLGRKPTDASVKMLTAFIAGRQPEKSQRLKQILFISASSKLDIPQEALHEMLSGSSGSFSVLAYAIHEKMNEIVTELIFSQVCLDDPSAGEQAIEYAEEVGNEEAVELLIQAGYKIDELFE